jgi:ribonuclease HI
MSSPGRACRCHQDASRCAENNSVTPNLVLIDAIERREGKSIFTNGSQGDGSNSGYGLHCIFFEESHTMEPSLSSFDAEVKVIVRAVERIAETAIISLWKTKFVILSESNAAIQFITKAENYDELSLSFKQNLVMIGMQKKLLQLQWIPSHCKIPGNEKADALSKIGA